jgi:hypothetical protein
LVVVILDRRRPVRIRGRRRGEQFIKLPGAVILIHTERDARIRKRDFLSAHAQSLEQQNMEAQPWVAGNARFISVPENDGRIETQVDQSGFWILSGIALGGAVMDRRLT